jgi:hypothetical protein
MQIRNKVVARFRDGRTIKGYTFDFTPNKGLFHVIAPDDDKKVTEISASDLKAIFYVKTFEGDSQRTKSHELAGRILQKVTGLKLKVIFHDAEVLCGTTNGYSKSRQGFFLIPVDRSGNNDRAYVLADSTLSVETWR